MIAQFEETKSFEKYLREAKKNWKEFTGYGSGYGDLSIEKSKEFIKDYNVGVKNFFIGVWAISINSKGIVSIAI
jgi:hypothetical protein